MYIVLHGFMKKFTGKIFPNLVLRLRKIENTNQCLAVNGLMLRGQQNQSVFSEDYYNCIDIDLYE